MAGDTRLTTTRTKQEVSATSLRGYLAWIDERGLRSEIRARVSPTTAALFDHPPPGTAWLDRTVLDEMYEAVAAVKGEDAVEEMSLATVRAAYAPIVRRFLQTILSLVGSSPATVFRRGNTFYGMFEKGTEYTYTDKGPRAGSLVVHTVQPASRVVFLAWRGVFRFSIELGGEKNGVVDSPVIAADGRSASYEIRW